jgi:uncharacterized protein (TIGR02145 family)
MRKKFEKMKISSAKWLPLFLLAGVLFLFSTGCEEEEVTVTPLETGTMTDREGNVYATVKIGDQWWMSENLHVKSYRNGDPVFHAETNPEWISDSVGAYCLFYNDTASPGLLYNGHAAMDERGLAPEGWHIPGDAEWKQLEIYLGMSSSDANKTSWRGTHEGEKLRVASPQGWTRYEEVWSTNESGFTALAGGCRLYDGTWGNPGLFATGFWWSSTVLDGTGGWYRYLDYKNANVFRSHISKKYGFSVRCVKN